jgi:hypothetical protein
MSNHRSNRGIKILKENKYENPMNDNENNINNKNLIKIFIFFININKEKII